MKRSFLLFSLLIAMASILAACDGEDLFAPMEYTASTDDVHSISIDVRDRRIDVSLSDDDRIHVDYFVSSKEGYDIDIADGCLSMIGTSDKNWTDFIGKKPSEENRRISLRIPERLFGNISLNTTNEDIYIHDAFSAEKIIFSSNGGNILFENLDAKKSITIDVKNGDIKGSIIGGWDDFSIHCDTKKGECNLPSEKASGEKILNVKANNGDVIIEFISR